MKKENIITILGAIGFIIAIGVASYVAGQSSDNGLAGLESDPNGYSGAAEYSSSTLVADTATAVLARATSTRNFAEICHVSGTSTVYLYKQATSTGVAVGMGHPIVPISEDAGNICKAFNIEDPYTGQIWAISEGIPKISVESKQK